MAGFYQNTATVTDSGTPPDPNTGNNTYVALAPVVSVVCSTTALSAGGTLNGVVNTYYPGTASVAKGATSIPVGTATGAGGTIANGSQLLVIQMQDASINDSNNVAYGNGYTGAGFTTINNAGNYEFVTATGPIAAGVGADQGSRADQRTGVRIHVCCGFGDQGTQHVSGGAGAAILVGHGGGAGGDAVERNHGRDCRAGYCGTTESERRVGSRGRARVPGRRRNGIDGRDRARTRTIGTSSPAAYTGVAEAGVDAPKGEGVAGTPEWVEFNSSYLQTTSDYPSGTAGTDGSMARGAPGNAGGGGTDADPGANDDNAGGGGGGNGGAGGFGGEFVELQSQYGWRGWIAFPATIDRIAMGGGGGAGTRNNSDTDNQASGGAAGGGMIFIRADSLTGIATMTANGAAAYNGTANDAGGGGGAGGTIVVLAANGGESGLTLQANGGRGGNAWQAEAYTLGEPSRSWRRRRRRSGVGFGRAGQHQRDWWRERADGKSRRPVRGHAGGGRHERRPTRRCRR